MKNQVRTVPRAGGRNAGPRCEYTQEVRFAVVLYGGVSLAVYMNGVARELLHLVRASAPRRDDERLFPSALPATELSGTEEVYRKVAQMLARERRDCRSLGETSKDATLQTRFVVDVISGTSAGGINGVFLAKALANDEAMAPLRDLWIEEADLGQLLNDKRSVEGPLASPRSPAALLNGQRLYWKLLSALELMGSDRKPDSQRARMAEELDLYLTATDIRGLPLPLDLWDEASFERRHRNVFHFTLRGAETTERPRAKGPRGARLSQGPDRERNDFGRKLDPFLAFAARCTSSFPVAFEPMRLVDIDEIVDAFPAYRPRKGKASEDDLWRQFFRPYLRPDGVLRGKVDYARRAFGDGGYLDNKPFSYAVQELMQRQADVPVDRKLLYIEPHPEHPELDSSSGSPNAIQNGFAAAFTVPHYETIREDLQQVIERNRLVERAAWVIDGMEKGVEYSTLGSHEIAGWDRRDLKEMVKEFGPAYGSYHRLKVERTTDSLAELVAMATGYEDTDYAEAIRYLVRVWRSRNYRQFHATPGVLPQPGATAPPTLNRFLLDFDLDYRLRRLSFVRSRIDILVKGGSAARKVLRHAQQRANSATSGTEIQVAQVSLGDDLLKNPRFRERLVDLKRGINLAHRRLVTAKRRLWAPGERNPLRKQVEALEIGEPDLHKLLVERSDQLRHREAAALLRSRQPVLQSLAEEIAGSLRSAMLSASTLCKALMNPIHAEGYELEKAVRHSVWWFYYYFDDYDVITYPLFYASLPGELDSIEILRLSPENAPSLIDEKREARNGARGRRKLAGTSLAHFGAFLEPAWRRNDILWGRLDAAERLIRALLENRADPGDIDALVRMAQAAIVKDELQPEANSRLMEMAVRALLDSDPRDAEVPKRWKRILKRLRLPGVALRPAEPLGIWEKGCDEILAHLASCYEVDRTANAKRSLESISRGTVITGKIVAGLEAGLASTPARWLTRIGVLLWGVVVVAVPQSMGRLFFGHFVRLLLFFEVLACLLGKLFGQEAVLSFGVKALIGTLAAYFVIAGLGRILETGRLPWWVKSLLGAGVLAAGTAWWYLGGLRHYLLRGLELSGSVLKTLENWVRP